jgi:diacylglycerol kinase (ATP)
MRSPLHPAARARSFGHALRGVAHVLRSQPNAWIHAVATLAVIGAGGWFDLSRGEWLVLVLTIAAVWTAEIFNSALEFLADAVHPEQHPLVGKAKDAAAAAVLVAALASVVVGLLIFGPRVLAP